MISNAEQFTQAEKSIPELANVPHDVLEQFRDNLKFANGGLAHSDYSMLQQYLDVEKLRSLFTHFGIDQKRFDLIRDTACVSRVCFPAPGQLCDEDRCRD
jgi:hypothetical protein